MAKPKKRADARTIAREAVQEWFENLLFSADSHTDGHCRRVNLESSFYEVRNALEAEFLRDHRFSENVEDRIVEHQIIAIDAGYLIGVQVGLRLRESVEVR